MALTEEIAMGHPTPSALAKLLDDASLEITTKDVEKLAERVLAVEEQA
jgi:hypothetical protein